MNDRLLGGFVAGILGGIAMNALNIPVYHLGISELRYLDWAAIAVFGTLPLNFAETLFALGVQILFVGLLGVVYAYLIPVISSKHPILRGLLFGSAVWFSLYGLAMIYQIEQTIPLRLGTALPDLAGALLYGLVTAATLQWLDKRAVV